MSSLDYSFWLIYQADFVLLLFWIIILEIPRYTISTIVVVFYRQKTKPVAIEHGLTVSVVLSVFNGENSLMACLQSINRQSYKPLEILVVDDGSSDRTRIIAERAKNRGLIDQIIYHGTRCGKSASINQAVRFAKGELVLTLDHDSVLKADAIAQLVNAFDDPKLALASGDLAIHNNKDSIWTSLQAIEYLISIDVGRSFLDLFGAVSCCSGAFSIFRRNIFMAIGGNNTGPGEDFELTLRMRKMGYRVRFVPEAHASVEAPTSFAALIRQRSRWDRDTLNTRVNQYRNLDIFRPKEFLSDSFHIIDFMIFEFFPTMVFPIYLAYIFYTLGSLALPYLTAIYLLTFGFYFISLAVAAIGRTHTLSLFDILMTPMFPLYQGVIMKCVRFVAFTREILFRDSRRDDYVPPRVRRALYNAGGKEYGSA